MASTFQLKSSSYQGRYLQLDCTQEKSISTNRSVIHWTLKTVGQESTYYTTGPTTVKINGEQVLYKARKAWNSEEFPAAPGSVSGTTSVAHDNTGKATISVELSTAIYTSTVTKKSGTWTLDDIPRAATLTAAPNFTDEDNPTITYSNPAGNAVTSIKACISWSGADDIEYRDISKTGTNYTFNLTDTERNALRWATINSPNLAVKFYVTTVIGGVTYYSTQDKIMTITNAKPQVSAVIKDVGTASTALTGSGDKIIKGYNYITAKITATALKGASIKTIKTTNGSTTLSGSDVVFQGVESNVFNVTVTDSRGYSTSLRVTKELINYVKLTSHLEATNPTTAGTATLNIKGNYFNGSFGATANTLSVQFRYKEGDGAYSNWQDANYTLSGNSYSATVELSGLDYRKAYTVQARAIDKINPAGIETGEKVIKSLTVYDWGENDFKFNVDVYDKNGGILGSEVVANDYDAMLSSGKALLESGWVAITPVANSPTAVYVAFKRHYTKKPVVLVTASSGVIGTQVLGASTNGTTNDGVNIVITRTNTTPTSVYYYVFGEVET